MESSIPLPSFSREHRKLDAVNNCGPSLQFTMAALNGAHFLAAVRGSLSSGFWGKAGVAQPAKTGRPVANDQ
jgi:hypothetical protein